MGLPEPPTHPAVDPAAHAAWLLRDQGRACAAMGSPLYALLLERAAEDVEAGGVTWTVLRAHVRPGRARALALRLMAAVHRLVLTGRAPRLARHFPSVGGAEPAEQAWPRFRDVLAEHTSEVTGLVALPCQTNEVGRAAALAVGFLEVAAATRLPLRCLEVGASAGLNLRWDHFRYGGGGYAWGPPDSPVDLSGMWSTPSALTPARQAAQVEVIERRGCDPQPVDPTTPGGRLALTAAVWADQVARIDRLRGALRLATTAAVTVDAASVDMWVREQLSAPAPGRVTVVFQSVVDEYLDQTVRERFRGALDAAGDRATRAAPLAWLRLEPASALREHALTLRRWPGSTEEILAVCGAHGTAVRRPGS